MAISSFGLRAMLIYDRESIDLESIIIIKNLFFVNYVIFFVFSQITLFFFDTVRNLY